MDHIVLEHIPVLKPEPATAHDKVLQLFCQDLPKYSNWTTVRRSTHRLQLET